MKNPNGNLFIAELGLIADSTAALEMRACGHTDSEFEITGPDSGRFVWAKNCRAVLVDDSGGVDTWRIYRVR